MSTSAPLDRRARRRQESLEEILDRAVEIMTEQGVAGLSVGELARRMGIRPPSLYVYFPSKNALYDALFARGAQSLLDTMQQATDRLLPADAELGVVDVQQVLLSSAETMVRWTLQFPALTQLLFWRPVPGFEPTPEAYGPAVALVALTGSAFSRLQDAGAFRADVPLDHIVRDWTVVIAGVISQQLSNAPHDSFETGQFTSALPGFVAMFARFYGPDPQRSDPGASRPAP